MRLIGENHKQVYIALGLPSRLALVATLLPSPSTWEWQAGESPVFTEADARIRTGDPFITSEVLYQLSYVG